MKAEASVASLLEGARQAPVLRLVRREPHPLGAVLGIASLLLGVWAYRSDWAARDTLAAVALGASLLGLVLHTVWQRAAAGWRVDFARRLLLPEPGPELGPEPTPGDAGPLPDGAVALDDHPGWAIAVVPGDRRGHVAIELRHADRGRVARLLDRPARGRSALADLSGLADVLAQRLGVARIGPRV